MTNNSLIKKIQNFSKQHNLWNKGDKIVVGVSGGPDSVYLLNMFYKLSKKYSLELCVAHVNYALRGEDSADDEAFVRDLAKEYDLKIEVLTFQKGNFSLEDSNLENELRNVRYDFFEKVRIEYGYDLIAVGHNEDDQAETFLMHILRGSGLQGMKGMLPKNESIIRPLLSVSRERILKYLENDNIDYRNDKTNQGELFFRNRVRNNLIPYLEKNYNPRVKKVFSRAASTVAVDYNFICVVTREKIKESVDFSVENQASFSVREVLSFHSSLIKHFLREVIVTLQGDAVNLESGNIEEIVKVLRSNKGKRHFIEFRNLKIERKGDKITLFLLNK